MAEKVPVLKIQIGIDSNYYIIPVSEWKSLYDTEISNMDIHDELIITRIPDMTQDEIDTLPEFEGF